MLLELEQENLIIMGEVLIRRKYPSIIEFASQIQDDRVKDCIFKKLAGKTLDEIGKIYNLTRERTRQIIVHALRTRPRLYEDKYLSIFEKYCIFADDFVLAFEESETTYNYLELVGQTKVQQKLPLKDLLEDDTISLEVKRRVEKAIYKNYIVINGVRLKVDRSELTQYYIKNKCKLPTKIDDVVEQYHMFLRSLNLQDEGLFWSDNRSFENKMNRSDYILWSRGKCIRYYRIKTI